MVLHGDKRASRNYASENWDDDFDFQSSAPSPIKEQKPVSLATSSLAKLEAAENWDDAYEDEDGGVAQARVPTKRESDMDTASWGSDSEWSGDGDAEDLSHESYTTSSPQSRVANPTTRFPIISHSPFTPAAAPSVAPSDIPRTPSLFSRLSPVKKWKARDLSRNTKTEARNAAELQLEAELPRKSRKQRSFVRQDTSSQRRVLSGGDVTQARPSKTAVRKVTPGQNQYSPPLQSDASSISPTRAPSSKLPLPVPTSAPTLATSPIAQIRSSMLLSDTNTGPLAIASTYNLPSTVAPQDDDRVSLSATPRRSSLGDLKRPMQLKIPERISRAQRDIKRDMGDVKEFAACIDQLMNLQRVYTIMLRDLRATLSGPMPEPAQTPLLLPLPRPRRLSLSPKKRRGTVAVPPQPSPTKLPTRKFSFANGASAPESIPIQSRFALAFEKLDTKYGVWWECAELLIALGGRPDDAPNRPIATEVQEDEAVLFAARGRRKRAVTLGSGSDCSTGATTGTGPPSASPPHVAQWRATTGRAGPRDLTPRQLVLLRQMLAADAGKRWDPRMSDMGGRAATSVNGSESARGKGRAPGLGIRELWRGLRRGMPSSSGESSASEGTMTNSVPIAQPIATQQQPTQVSTPVLSRRKQPTRRPSLAGIFGLGRSPPPPQQQQQQEKRPACESEEDWDRMDVDQDANVDLGRPVETEAKTIRAAERPNPAVSTTSHSKQASPQKVIRSPRLFISFTETLPNTSATASAPKLKRTFTNVRAPQPRVHRHLALSPENIRPLLGHAHHVGAQLNECIGEVREMMGGTSSI